MYKPKVYTASKLHHRPLWLKLREDPDWDFVQWTATWVNSLDVMAELQGRDVAIDDYTVGWSQNIRDVRASDFILLYGGSHDALRGALIEAGAAIACGITVITVALDANHNWAYHPGVRNYSSFRDARAYLYKFVTMVPRSRQSKTQ